MDRVTSITVAAQHPEGLKTHLDNISWAINRPKDMYVLTFEKWGFEKDMYPGVHFIEVDADPLQNNPFYQFWDKEGLELIQKIRTRTVILNQLDILYQTRLHLYIQEVEHNPDLLFVLEAPIKGRYSLFKEDVFVYPRVYEAGLIVNTSLMLQAIEMGVRFGNGVRLPALRQFMIRNKLGFFVDGSIRSLGSAYKNTEIKGDCFAEFMLFCYMRNIRAVTRSYAVHLQAPETLHLNHPDLYSEFDLNVSALKDLDPSRTAATAISLFLAGKCKWESCETCLQEIRWKFGGHLRMLRRYAHKWMPQEQLERLKKIMEAITSS